MTKAKISEYDAVAANNTDVNGVNIAEGCPPSGMNNMGREIMAALKRFQTGADGDSVTVGGSLVVSNTLTAGPVSATTLNTSGAVVFNDAGADVDFRVEGDTDANLLFVDASTDRVGIGTSSPASNLQVSNTAGYSTVTFTGSSSSGGILAFVDSDGVTTQRILGFGSNSGENTSLRFDTNGGERMRIDSSGNVGIGTSSPAVKLSIKNDDATTNPNSGVNTVLRLENANTTANNFASVDFSNGTTSTSAIVASFERGGTNAGNLQFHTRNSAGISNERVRISATNFISTVPVDVRSTISGARCFEAWNQATSGDNVFITFYTEGGSGTLRGLIDYNRTAGLTRYNTTSDATLKNIIGDSDGAKSVEILNSTRIREYAWKDDETQKPQIGVIAQELYETYKGAVSVGGDVEKERDITEEVEEEYTDENGETQTRTVTKVTGKETHTEYRPWAVDKTAFTFHLVAGWQAHEKLIKQQAETIAALEARIAALENA